MTSRFVVSITCGKDEPDRVTVAFTLANAALGSEQETVVFLSSEGVHLAVNGYADDVAEEGFSPLGQLMSAFAEAGGQIYTWHLIRTYFFGSPAHMGLNHPISPLFFVHHYLNCSQFSLSA